MADGDNANREEAEIDWHAQTAEATLAGLDTSADGLEPAEIEARLERYGENRQRPPKRRSRLERLASQFHNLLIYLLLIAAGITAALGHWIDTGVIVAVVVINAIIGYIQEGKAETAMAAIRGLLAPEAVVRRGGQRQGVDATRVVPGDILILEPGAKVGADVRLTRSSRRARALAWWWPRRSRPSWVGLPRCSRRWKRSRPRCSAISTG